MLVTPAKIRTLQRKLFAKAKQEPAYRFYALYDKVYRADLLNHAWRLVRSNGGSPGIDGLSFEAIERGEGVAGLLRHCRGRPAGNRCMPWHEGHRKAVCGKTACTV